MRNYLKLDYIFYKSTSQTEIVNIQEIPYEIINEKVWLNDVYQEVSSDIAEDPLLYKDSEYNDTLKVSVKDGTLISLTPKIKAINTVTNKEIRVYRDIRSGINVDTLEEMRARLIQKIVDDENVRPTPPPNQTLGPDMGDFRIDLGPSLTDDLVEERKPLGERI